MWYIHSAKQYRNIQVISKVNYIIVIDDQQDANFLGYLIILNQLYMFRTKTSPETCRAD